MIRFSRTNRRKKVKEHEYVPFDDDDVYFWLWNAIVFEGTTVIV